MEPQVETRLTGFFFFYFHTKIWLLKRQQDRVPLVCMSKLRILTFPLTCQRAGFEACRTWMSSSASNPDLYLTFVAKRQFPTRNWPRFLKLVTVTVNVNRIECKIHSIRTGIPVYELPLEGGVECFWVESILDVNEHYSFVKNPIKRWHFDWWINAGYTCLFLSFKRTAIISKLLHFFLPKSAGTWGGIEKETCG